MLIGVLHTGKRPFTADDRDLKLRAILADQPLNAALTQLHAG